ncbi:MAG: DUF1653 domain-containing protein [Johnsonella sp.]|nr:DUF1653 domain-containing protein [Johnsonella sp.]
MEKKDQALPRQGDFYRHFKGGLYQIITIAKHSESKEILVVYQALYGDFSVYARPLSMFCERLDPKKYPEAKGRLRFERIEAGSLVKQGSPEQNLFFKEEGGEKEGAYPAEEDLKSTEEKEEELAAEEVGDYFLDFLEAKSYADKREVLLKNKSRFTKKDLSGIYTLLEIAPFGGELLAQIRGIAKYLETQSRFEGKRLRE